MPNGRPKYADALARLCSGSMWPSSSRVELDVLRALDADAGDEELAEGIVGPTEADTIH